MMNQKLWIGCAVLAIVCANTGCVSCCHKSYAKAWKNGPECELPPDCRGNVYVFMVTGVTPTDCGLSKLREQLAECGFAKVGVSDIVSSVGIACEIKELAKCEPDARFVLIGYDFGAAAAVCIARDLSAKNIPIEAVVLLDPLGCGKPSGVRTLLITSGTMTSSAVHSDRVIVHDASHFKLPTHQTTVATITDLLKEIATTNYHSVSVSQSEWYYEHAPEMRPIPLARGGSWDFLADNGTAPLPIGSRAETTTLIPTVNASNLPSASSGAVVIPK